MARFKTGDRVLLLDKPGQMPEFAGKTGCVLHTEMCGRDRYYRIRLDEPVNIDGVGRVTDDLWTAGFFKKVRP